jgi:hypothetical protein
VQNMFENPSRVVVTVASVLLLMLPGWQSVGMAAQLTATWVDNSTDELGFSVERSTGTTGTFSEVGTMGPGITTYTDIAVADATTYCYRVRAYNASAYSDYSNVACATTASLLNLTVVEMGTGSGSVISTPSGIICGATCSGRYAGGTAVTLRATPAAGSTFTGWAGGGCGGIGTCTVTVTDTTTITATFHLPASSSVSGGYGDGDAALASAEIFSQTPVSTSIPTLSERAMIVLAALLVVFGVAGVRRHGI